MHIYIYDNYVNQKKYEKNLAAIETRLTDLGLNGKIVRMDTMNNIQESVQDEIRRGAKTIVAVGNNSTLSQVVSAVMSSSNKYLYANLPIGIIPIDDQENDIAAMLGIANTDEACNILLARKIEKLDIGCANDNFFIARAEINGQDTIIKINDDYSLESLKTSTINIYNLLPDTGMFSKIIESNPQDGILELLISAKPAKKILALKTKKKNLETYLSINNITLYNENEPLLLDGSVSVKCPAHVFVIKNAVSLIVGKNRKF
jgi:diacylglycerol kinase family enzyme